MNELKVVTIINGKYKDKNGVERLSKNFYLVFNNKYIAIKPSFDNGYRALELISSEVINKEAK